VAPLFYLAEQVVQLQAQPDTPGAFYQGMRLMALDGFVLDVADSEANARVFGRPGSHRSAAAFPQARVLALCEVGTHVLWRTRIKPCRRGEVTMAPSLLRDLQNDMLLLWDRGFLSYALVQQVQARQAQLLARIKKNLVFKPLKRLGDGSYLAKFYNHPLGYQTLALVEIEAEGKLLPPEIAARRQVSWLVVYRRMWIGPRWCWK
jgi:hypothetical protein